MALFGQGTYRVTKELAFNFGARFGREEVSTVASGALLPGALAPVIPANLNPVSAELKDTYNSFKAGAQYALTPDNMVYMLYTKGYKGPTVNDVIPQPDTPVIVRPEIPKTWELGLKNAFLDGRVGLHATIYHTKATDYQTTTLVPGTLDFVFGNIPSATFKGASLSFYGRVTPDLMINGGLSRMKSETATTRPGASFSFVVTYGVRGSSVGWRRFHSSVATPSRASSFHEVTDQVEAATPHSSASSRAASVIHGKPTPEASSCTWGAPSGADVGASATL